MWPLLQVIGPRILIPGFFVGPKLAAMNDWVQIFQTVALSALFITFAVTLFSDSYWLAPIPGIAAWAYWNMLKHEDQIDMYRYADWALTTPLMLLAILTVNGASVATKLGAVLLDLLMIGAGYYGAVEPDQRKKMQLFLLGCVAFIPILYIIYTMKRAKWAIGLTLVMWLLYPMVWYADETKAVASSTANITYSVMDVIAKVGLVNLLHI
jgi:sensory rhodopsin